MIRARNVALCVAALASVGVATSHEGEPPAPPAPPAAPPVPPPVPTRDNSEEIRTKARADLLKEMGLSDAEAGKKLAAKAKEDEERTLSDVQKAHKALKDSEAARAEALAESSKHAEEIKALRVEIESRDRHVSFLTNGVNPKELAIVDVILSAAKADAKAVKADFDEAKFWTDTRKERPYLFSSASPPPPPPAFNGNQQQSGRPPTAGPPPAPGNESAFVDQLARFKANPGSFKSFGKS